MLLQFSVENFLSFRERTTLSMLAAPGVKHRPEHVISLPDGRQVLRCAALYGANASGKSNLVKAFEFAQHFIKKGTTEPGGRIPVAPFRLAPKSEEQPSSFEFIFLLGDRIFSYGFSVDAQQVREEWLHELSNPSSVIFERGTDASPNITLGDHPLIPPERREFFRFVAEGTRDNQLFLTEIALRKGEEFKYHWDFFAGGVSVLSTATRVAMLAWLVGEKSSLDFAQKLLTEAGTGVVGVRLEQQVRRREEMPGGIFPYLGDSEFIDAEWEDGGQSVRLTRALLRHQGVGGSHHDFLLQDESDGTRELLRLCPIVAVAQLLAQFALLQGSGTKPFLYSRIFVADELERSLHPLLSRFLVQRFLSDGTGGPSQLIFTTHDTDLLDLRLLPRDGIWFAEKNHEGATSLYSLAEFKAEQIDKLGDSLEADYLKGRFGAIPFHGDLRKLGWLDEPPAAPAPEPSREPEGNEG